MKPNIYVTRRLPEAAMELLEKNFELECNPFDRVLTHQELLEKVKGRDGLLPLLTDRIDGEVLDIAGKQLRVVANYAVGFNNIDVPAATARKIAVTNTPGVLTDTTADLTLALILGVARRLVESDRYARAGKYEGWAPLLFLGADVHHKTLGLMGFGRIGYAVAKRALGFDMRVLYHDHRRADPELEKQAQAQYVDRDTLLQEADFLSIHVPLTPETTRFMSTREFSLMKQTAYIVNTSRGEVIDEAALVEALKNREIAGAGLDVFEHEPAISPALLTMDNVIILPHIGSASTETRTKMGLMAAENLIAVFQDRVPPNCLNPEVFGK
jgi:lactate dehydrogenase-like 2-hydroxyacid dehydrogenase